MSLSTLQGAFLWMRLIRRLVRAGTFVQGEEKRGRNQKTPTADPPSPRTKTFKAKNPGVGRRSSSRHRTLLKGAPLSPSPQTPWRTPSTDELNRSESIFKTGDQVITLYPRRLVVAVTLLLSPSLVNFPPYTVKLHPRRKT